ncbi:MAG: anti-sigma factor family protein [Candidatus Zixiibacteriota bacterium]
MTCRHASSLLEDYIDGDLSGELADRMRVHLESCNSCRIEYHRSQHLRTLMGRIASPDPGSTYWSEIDDLVRAKTSERAVWSVAPSASSKIVQAARGRILRSALSVAFSSLILLSAVLLGSGGLRVATEPTEQGETIMVAASVQDYLSRMSPLLYTVHDYRRLARGINLVGPPGFSSRLVAVIESKSI